MLRQRLKDELKVALKGGKALTTSTLRLILAAIKDKDIAARNPGERNGIDDSAIIDLMQKMVRQRQESIQLYERGNRQELADKEKAEIEIIERFLPPKMSMEETDKAVKQAIDATGAATLKDMGKVISYLKEHFAGRLDLAVIGQHVKQKLQS